MTEGNEKEQRASEFMIAEYQEIYQENRRKRGEGLQRLNFLISLTTTIIGGLIILFQLGSLSNTMFQFIALGSTLFLIVVAWGTFRFSIYRDIYTDGDLRAAARIRMYFVNQVPEIRSHLSWEMHDEPTTYLKRDISDTRRTTQTILAMLGGLFTGISLNLLTNSLVLAVIAGILFTAIFWFLLRAYTQRELKKGYDAALDGVRFPRQTSNVQQPPASTSAQEAIAIQKENHDA